MNGQHALRGRKRIIDAMLVDGHVHFSNARVSRPFARTIRFTPQGWRHQNARLRAEAVERLRGRPGFCIVEPCPAQEEQG